MDLQTEQNNDEQYKEQKRTELSKKAMLEALVQTRGVVTSAAKIARIERTIHYIWMQDDQDYQKAVNEINEISLDETEDSLYSKIKNGDTTAILYHLNCKGRKRGWGNRTEVDLRGNLNLTKSDQEVLDEIDAIKARLSE